MRNYELGFVLHPQVEQADVTQAVERVGQYLAAGGGEVAVIADSKGFSLRYLRLGQGALRKLKGPEPMARIQDRRM